MEGQSQQASLSPRDDLRAEVEERRVCKSPIGFDDADPTRLLDDVQPARVTGSAGHEDGLLETVGHRHRLDDERVQVRGRSRRLGSERE